MPLLERGARLVAGGLLLGSLLLDCLLWGAAAQAQNSVVQFSDREFRGTEGETVFLTLIRTGDTSAQAIVDIGTFQTGDSATPPGLGGADYTLADERVTFAANAIFANISVTLENGTLFAQPTGQRRASLVAVSEARFALNGTEVYVSFTKDESGTVTGLVVHQNGTDTPVRKVS